MLEIYSYQNSFIIELTFCSICNTYYSKESEPNHTCKPTSSQEKIDIMQEISDNLSKVKPPKEKK